MEKCCNALSKWKQNCFSHETAHVLSSLLAGRIIGLFRLSYLTPGLMAAGVTEVIVEKEQENSDKSDKSKKDNDEEDSNDGMGDKDSKAMIKDKTGKKSGEGKKKKSGSSKLIL